MKDEARPTENHTSHLPGDLSSISCRVSPSIQASETRILKSTFIMGGAAVVNSLLGVVRTKVIALILGPSGVGLTGIYISIINVVSTLSGMGIGESGVRQIAGAVGSHDVERISSTVVTVRRVAFLSGLAGLSIMIAFNVDISRMTFGTILRSPDITIISFVILFEAIVKGQSALIQGVRRIGDLAKVNIVGAVSGTALSIPMIYLWGERGIPYYLLVVSATGILTSWWYSRRIGIPSINVTFLESLRAAKPLLGLGAALMLGALMSVATQYVLRVVVVQFSGLGGAGVFHASTTLSLVYVGIILNAMLTDYYPRLSSAADRLEECTFLINKQVEVGVLLAIPGILAIMTFAPLVITVFYSSKFMLAVEVLRWQILGVLLQVVAWPLGFMLRAQGNGKMFLLTELFANLVYLCFAWVGLPLYGLPGVGMAFFVMNVLYLALIYLVLQNYYQFRFSPPTLKTIVLLSLLTAVVFVSPYLLNNLLALAVNTAVIVASCVYVLKTFTARADADFPGFLLKIKGLLHI